MIGDKHNLILVISDMELAESLLKDRTPGDWIKLTFPRKMLFELYTVQRMIQDRKTKRTGKNHFPVFCYTVHREHIKHATKFLFFI